MTAPPAHPQMRGKRHCDILADIGSALLIIKHARGITLAEMADTLRKSDDQVARYIAGEMEMGAVAWLRANEEWPELAERIAETAAEREAQARQRDLPLNGRKRHRPTASQEGGE